MQGDFGKAAIAFEKALRLNPNLQDARNGYNAAKYNSEHPHKDVLQP
jgi:cytochrome c-type biogenesis protein CcmH/NrfG